MDFNYSKVILVLEYSPIYSMMFMWVLVDGVEIVEYLCSVDRIHLFVFIDLSYIFRC